MPAYPQLIITSRALKPSKLFTIFAVFKKSHENRLTQSSGDGWKCIWNILNINKIVYKRNQKNQEKMLGKGMTLIVFLLNEPFSVKFNVGVIVARCWNEQMKISIFGKPSQRRAREPISIKYSQKRGLISANENVDFDRDALTITLDHHWAQRVLDLLFIDYQHNHVRIKLK